MTPAKAKKKICAMYGPLAVEVDEYGEKIEPLDRHEQKTLCVARECMNWVQEGHIGFCVRMVDSETMKKVWAGIFSK